MTARKAPRSGALFGSFWASKKNRTIQESKLSKKRFWTSKESTIRIPGEQGLAKKISGEKKDPIPSKPPFPGIRMTELRHRFRKANGRLAHVKVEGIGITIQ